MSMQINSAANQNDRVLSRSTTSARTEKNFADQLSAQSKAPPSTAPIGPAGVSGPAQAITLADLYEQMTMKSAANLQGAGKTVSGVHWTDEMLALLTGAKYGVEIDTTKTINWNATGDQKLTDEQMSALRSRYNLENLSPQDYYDLMSDLTNMNAISAEDIHGMHLKTAPPAGIYPASSSFGGRSFTSGNIFDAIKDDLSSMSGLNDFLLSDDFWLMNANVDREQHSGYLNYLQSRTNSMNKLSQIFAGIRG